MIVLQENNFYEEKQVYKFVHSERQGLVARHYYERGLLKDRRIYRLTNRFSKDYDFFFIYLDDLSIENKGGQLELF